MGLWAPTVGDIIQSWLESWPLGELEQGICIHLWFASHYGYDMASCFPPCCLDLPSMRYPELWTRINPFPLKSSLSEYFIIAKGKGTKTECNQWDITETTKYGFQDEGHRRDASVFNFLFFGSLALEKQAAILQVSNLVHESKNSHRVPSDDRCHKILCVVILCCSHNPSIARSLTCRVSFFSTLAEAAHRVGQESHNQVEQNWNHHHPASLSSGTLHTGAETVF